MLFWSVFFFKNRKRTFSGVQNGVEFQICISAFVFYCKRKLNANFHKKILINLGPLQFFEKENFDPCTMHMPKFWNWSKITPDLWLLDLFCLIKKNSTIHPNTYAWEWSKSDLSMREKTLKINNCMTPLKETVAWEFNFNPNPRGP